MIAMSAQAAGLIVAAVLLTLFVWGAGCLALVVIFHERLLLAPTWGELGESLAAIACWPLFAALFVAMLCWVALPERVRGWLTPGPALRLWLLGVWARCVALVARKGGRP